MGRDTVGVAVCGIPPRSGDLLKLALVSIAEQTLVPDQISVAIDHDKQGAGPTRDRAWRALTTDWVAFLDDDDEFLPEHLVSLLACAKETGADMVFPWFYVNGGTDPFPQHFKREWDPVDPRQTTITCLWRRDALVRVNGFEPVQEGPADGDGNRAGEDFAAVCRLNAIGGRIVHLPKRTWIWRHHGRNTSGLPSRWEFDTV